jgi:putative tributyrin esterase
MTLRRIAALLLCLWCFAAGAAAQRSVVAYGASRIKVASSDGRTQVLELDSRLLKRKVWLKVLLPEKYADPERTGQKFPVMYLLHGWAGGFRNWMELTSVVDYTAGTNWIAVAPEGANGWYTDSATVPDDKFESYIVEEVIPEIDHLYRTIAESRGRVIAGLSMGGYGAIKFGLKYPDLFSVVGSFSGAFDAPLGPPKLASLQPSISTAFGPEGSKTRAENDIFRLLRDAPPERLKKLPFIYLDCGTEDTFFEINRSFDALLVEKKVPHEYRELPGGHSWNYWDRQVQEFIRVVGRR